MTKMCPDLSQALNTLQTREFGSGSPVSRLVLSLIRLPLPAQPLKFPAFTSQNTGKFVVNSREFTKFTRYHLSGTYWHLLVCISQNSASVAGSGGYFSIQVMYFFTATLYYIPTVFSLSSVPSSGALHLRFVCLMI